MPASSTFTPIHVKAHSGYRANERPEAFTLDGRHHVIVEIEARWYEPHAEYFKVRTNGGRRWVLRYDERAQETDWTLDPRF